MSLIVNSPPMPRLVLIDQTDRQGNRSTLPNVIQFKFQPVDFGMDVGSAWASSTGMNREQPIIQFSHGEQRGFNFGMKLFAKDKSDNSPDADLKALQKAVEKDSDLNRPPRWQFIWGQFVNETVVVKSIGGVKIGLLRQDGTLRDVTLSIQLLLYQPVDLAIATADDRVSNTYYAVTKRGDQWEDIALREYDEPAYGDVLRQANPQVMFPGSGSGIGKIVTLPKLVNIANTVIAPSSIPLQRTTAGLTLRSQMYAERSVSRQSAVLKS